MESTVESVFLVKKSGLWRQDWRGRRDGSLSKGKEKGESLENEKAAGGNSLPFYLAPVVPSPSNACHAGYPLDRKTNGGYGLQNSRSYLCETNSRNSNSIVT